jgi:hypothetical protein
VTEAELLCPWLACNAVLLCPAAGLHWDGQVAVLQQQVVVLQQSREAQDRELSRLKTEALTLAARTAAAGGAGATAGGVKAAATGAGGPGPAEGKLVKELRSTVAEQVSSNCFRSGHVTCCSEVGESGLPAACCVHISSASKDC